MIFVLTVLYFGIGGSQPTEIETYTYKTEQECMSERLKIQNATETPTEAICTKESNG